MSDQPTRARFNGRAAWSRITEDQKEEIGAIALELAIRATFGIADLHEDDDDR